MTDALVAHAAARAQIERLQPQQPLTQGDDSRQMALDKHARIPLDCRAGAVEKRSLSTLHFTADLADVSDVEVCHVAAAAEMQF